MILLLDQSTDEGRRIPPRQAVKEKLPAGPFRRLPDSRACEEQLTPKEMEVVPLICRDFRSKEIMSALNISEQSVKSRFSRTMKKFGVNDRLQPALHAVRRRPSYLCDL